MRSFLSRLSAHAGSALAAGGSVLAVGAALGAVGLAELQSGASPFDNGWIVSGVAIITAGAVWSILTFILVLVAAAKTERFQELLGHALNDAEALEREGAPKTAIRDWGQQTHDLIEAGLGPGEGRLFLGEFDLGTEAVFPKNLPLHPWLHRRLTRLSRLMDRMHSMHVGAGAKMKDWTYLSSKRPPEPRD
jgi:hypothetical protein